jgi:hypothetical protein
MLLFLLAACCKARQLNQKLGQDSDMGDAEDSAKEAGEGEDDGNLAEFKGKGGGASIKEKPTGCKNACSGLNERFKILVAYLQVVRSLNTCHHLSSLTFPFLVSSSFSSSSSSSSSSSRATCSSTSCLSLGRQCC